jgi:polyhydroxyalkanoate synthesis regulator phasin
MTHRVINRPCRRRRLVVRAGRNGNQPDEEDDQMAERSREFIPDFVKDGWKRAVEPLGKIDEAIEAARDAVAKNVERIDGAQLRSVFDDLLGKVRTARVEAEERLAAGMTRTLHAINVPTRKEFEVIKKDLAKLAKDVKSIKGPAPAKKAAKKPTKKVRWQ